MLLCDLCQTMLFFGISTTRPTTPSLPNSPHIYTPRTLRFPSFACLARTSATFLSSSFCCALKASRVSRNCALLSAGVASWVFCTTCLTRSISQLLWTCRVRRGKGSTFLSSWSVFRLAPYHAPVAAMVPTEIVRMSIRALGGGGMLS